MDLYGLNKISTINKHTAGEAVSSQIHGKGITALGALVLKIF